MTRVGFELELLHAFALSTSYFCFRWGEGFRHLVAGEGAGCGRRVVLLAGIVVEHADDHKGVGASEARASLRLLDRLMVEKSEGVWGCGTAFHTQNTRMCLKCTCRYFNCRFIKLPVQYDSHILRKYIRIDLSKVDSFTSALCIRSDPKFAPSFVC